MDDHNHGTHVSGTIGATGNNNKGIVGVNWDVTIIGCKFLSSSGSGSTANAIECVEYLNALKQKGFNIVSTNNSWGGGGFDSSLSNAMGTTIDGKKIIHVMSAGNSNFNNDIFPTYPAGKPISNKLVVAASDRNDNYASFSNYGANSVHLSAPGASILSTIEGGGYATASGTSMAAPHVTGAVALLLSVNPSFSYDVAQNTILSGVDYPPVNSIKRTITDGRLNIGNIISNGPPSNIPPTADVGGPYTGTVGSSVSFDGTGSSDSDGNVASFAWDFGDGNFGTGATPTHTYSAAGSFTVSLIVTDNDSDASSAVDTTATISEVSQPVKSVTIDSPDTGDISGKITISATVDGFDLVNSVTFEIFKIINGVQELDPAFSEPDYNSPYSVSVHTKNLDDGYQYNIFATANDGGDEKSQPRLVNIPAKGSSGGGGSDKCHPKRGC
jgi:PKD repeat protein